MMNRINDRGLRRGETNPSLLVGLGIAGVVIVGIIIAVLVHQHNKEKARTSSQAHIAACKELQLQIQQEKSPLSGCGLSFQPYTGRFDSAARKQKQAEAVFDRDPHQSDRLAGEAEQEFKSVLSDLQLAVQVKTDRSGAASLDEAERSVAAARLQPVEFSFPGSSGPRGERYRYDEEGNNPDTHLGASRRLLSGIGAALDEGNPREAQRLLQEAKSEAREAQGCMDRALACKKRVESEISAVSQKCEPADSTREADLRKAYFAQNFVAAAARLDALKKLIDDRQETRELLAYCQRFSRDVGRTLDDNRDYSAPATDQKFETLKLQLSGLADAVKRGDADWSELRASAQRIEKGLTEVRDEAIQSHKDYDDALFAVRSFRRDYEDADRNGTPPLSFWSQAAHPDITDPVKDQVNDVNALLTRIDRQMKLNKQDWRRIKSDAESGVKLLADLKKMVEEDNRKLDDLRAAKDLLSRVTSYSRYSCFANGRSYSAGDANRRDGDYVSHSDNASDRYSAAQRAWRARERVGFDDAMRSLKQEIGTVNDIGWFNMLRIMRNSSDPVARRIAFDNGYRDDKSRIEWEDGFVKKRAAGPDGLWQPDTSSTTGGDDDPLLDFKAPLAN